MSGGKAPKAKGDAGEREIVKMFPGSQRTYWQPGNNKRSNSARGDVLDVPYLGRVEVKRRKDFKTMYDWLADNGALFIRGDHRTWLAVMPAEGLKLLLDEMDELKRQNAGVGT